MTKRNAIDKAIEFMSPEWAERRLIARHNLRVYNEITPGYKGGASSRRRQISGGSGREDTSIGGTYSRMIAAAMNLYRNDPMTRSIVDVVDTYMGESVPSATTSDSEWNKRATEYFRDYWWHQADARRRPGVDYGTLQSLWEKFTWVGGDMLFALFDGSLYPYEGIQIQTPWDLRGDQNVINGVRIAKTAPHRITHYYITEGSKPAFFNTAKSDFKRIRQSEAIFAPSKYWRPAMVRGVPELHAVIDALQDWDDTSNNVQGLIKLQSSIWTVERKGALGNIPGSRLLDKSTSDGTQVEYATADYGMRFKINGEPERDFKVNHLNNPGAMHVPYMEHMARVISAGVGLPYEAVMHMYTQGSYTANRAARLDLAKFIVNRWAWRNKVLNNRAWNWVIARAVKNGELPPAPVDESTGRSEWRKVSWTLPHFPHIDEGKEVIADIKQWGCGQESIADWAQQKGRTREQLLDAHDEDLRAIKERADALEIPLEQYMGQLFTASAAPQPELVKG